MESIPTQVPLCSAIVRLNVGGRHFDTTRDTLSRIGFFMPWLEGRFELGCDDNGRYFIDRDGDIFALLLRFIRSAERPPRSLTELHKEALLMECDFFGIDSLTHHLHNKISPYDMRREDRLIQEAELCSMDDDRLVEFFRVEHHPLERELLQPHMLLCCAKTLRPNPVINFETFFYNLNDFSGNLMSEFSGIEDIVIAGGSIIGSLVQTTSSDLDIFLTCGRAVAQERIKSVYDVVRQNIIRRFGDNSRLLVTRTLNAITFHACGNGFTHDYKPVQIILKLATSIANVLQSFDVDCCCFAFVPSTRKLLCTQRGLRSVRFGANLADCAFGGGGYTSRLEKYAQRGFAIAPPGYAPRSVRAELLSDRYAYFTHSKLLLKLGKCIWRCNDQLKPKIMESCRIIPENMCSGTVVKNLARLVVLDRGPPTVTHHDNDRLRLHAHVRVPLQIKRSGEYMVIEGIGLADKTTNAEHTQEDNEDDMYVPLLGDFVDLIMNKDREDTTSDKSKPWRMGGCIKTKERSILCVYDLLTCEAGFDSLHWVLDARQSPHNQHVSIEIFEKRYAFPALVTFPYICQRQRLEDFTSGVYR